MRFKKAFLLLVFVFSFVTSCRSSRQVVQKNDTYREVISKNIVSYKDTILYAPSSETQLKLPVDLWRFKDSLKGFKTPFKPQIFSQKNGNATVKVRVERDTIKVIATCDSLAIAAKIKTQYAYQLDHIKTELNKLEIKTKGVSYFKAILWVLSAFIIGIGIGMLIKTLKII